MTLLQQAVDEASERLAAAGVPSPRAAAELLAGPVLGLGRGGAAARALAGGPLAGAARAAFGAPVARRAAREPLPPPSPEAFAWATRNAESAGAENLSLVLGDLADALPELDGAVDVVVSNPPYIPTDAVPRDPEVRLHDPELALYGGEDGLDVVRVLSRRALALLRPGGALVVEHAEVQGPAIRALLAADGWRAPATHPDLLGRPRATTAVR